MNDLALMTPSSECVLAYVGDGDPGHAVIREASRLASQLQAKWIALYVESARADEEEVCDRICASQRLAATLGGEVTTIASTNVAEEILGYARGLGVTQIVVGQSAAPPWLARWRGSLARQIVVQAPEIHVHVVPISDTARLDTTTVHRQFLRPTDLTGVFLTIGLVALVTALGVAAQPLIETFGIAPMYLAVVLLAAARYGLLSALVASALATLALDFFFLEPLYELNIADPRDAVALLTFAAIAVVTSQFSGRLRADMLTARRRARINAELYSFSRMLAGASTEAELLRLIVGRTQAMLSADAVLLLSVENGRGPSISEPTGQTPTPDELRCAHDVVDRNEATHLDDRTLFPLRTSRRILGVLIIRRSSRSRPLNAEDLQLVTALTDQATVAIERTRLAGEVEETRVLREADKLRSALLTSVSHDLRTPLAAVLAALQTLESEGVGEGNPAHGELLETAREESERLNRFVGNLLDMTRIEGGAIAPRFEPADLADIIGSAARRAANLLSKHRLAIDLEPDLPMVSVDFVLIEQVVFNLLDNAAKYAPPDSTVTIRAFRMGESAVLEIADEGEGVPESELDRIFEKFHRLKAGDRQRAGTGLGLGICRGFVEAHGGTITARNRSDRSGAVFVITLPWLASASAVVPALDFGPAAPEARSPEGDNPRQAR